MESLYELIRRAKENDPEAIRCILHMFEPKIKKSSQFLASYQRDDMEQEIKMELIRALHRFDTGTTPGFWAFIADIKYSS
ncbi:helix-turn-helix domain-containing protein [Aneurinibacillus sp. REN35]|uniref:helix-turn-helix domain-containing protein n=1 Tax=Aneurinibacillus sp. REN35 TaxID=3237286 RepID=UPI00352985AC